MIQEQTFIFGCIAIMGVILLAAGIIASGLRELGNNLRTTPAESYAGSLRAIEGTLRQMSDSNAQIAQIAAHNACITLERDA